MRNPLHHEAVETEDPDRTLVEAARDGDKAALEQLIVVHQPWIYNIAFRMVMDNDDASDITQEILIKIITNLALYDPQKGAFRTWVYRIVVNYVLNMKKRSSNTGSTTLMRSWRPSSGYRITAITLIPRPRSWPKR